MTVERGAPVGADRATQPLRPVWASETGFPYHAVNDVATLGSMLHERVAAAAAAADTGAGLSAFLCAAGMWQAVEDHLHRDVLGLRRASKRAERLQTAASRMLAHCLRTVAGRAQVVRSARSTERLLTDLAAELTSLARGLAELVAGADPRQDAGWRRMMATAERTNGLLTRSPHALRLRIAIPPRCFSSFDQRPEDCRRLAAAFAQRWPDRCVPVALIGVRTSGSYLAPLTAAELRRLGYGRVAVWSWRPGQSVLLHDRRVVTALAANRGLALIVDDPPTSGSSLAQVASALEALGLPASSIVFLLQVFDSPGDWAWPQRLSGRNLVLLGWESWSVHERLTAESVRLGLEELLVGRMVTIAGGDKIGPRVEVGAILGAERLREAGGPEAGQSPSPREHVRAVYRVRVRDAVGALHVHHVYVKGVGVGFFGQQPAAIATRLQGLVPETYGVRDGLLYRTWLPEAARVVCQSAVPIHEMAKQAVAYVGARRAALPVGDDVALRVVGQETVWESCARWAGLGFGRLALPLQPLLNRAARQLVRAPRPSLIDGGTRLGDWFALNGAPMVKVGFDDRAFRHQVPPCYDAAYDLACLAVDHDDPRFGDLLRAEYQNVVGERVSDERWLLYRLLRLRGQLRDQTAAYHAQLRQSRRDGSVSHGGAALSSDALLRAMVDAEQAMSAMHQRYFGDVFLAGVEPASAGALCAIDVDGVLETSTLSYPGITPAGALALRALARHGFRAVIATGRSLDDVRERCVAYRLPGGVAEYGAALYDNLRGKAHSLLTDRARADLDTLRHVLAEDPTVAVDHRYRHAVRAYHLVDGHRRGLKPAAAAAALSRAGVQGRVHAIAGWAQTDFMAGGVDKGTGLRALADVLGEPADHRFLALAVGDSWPDLAMFAHAQLACAPGNADPGACRAHLGLRKLRRSYQAGLLEAVELLLGHRAERCTTCDLRRLDGEPRLLMAILAAPDHAGLAKVGQALRLALAVRRSGRSGRQ